MVGLDARGRRVKKREKVMNLLLLQWNACFRRALKHRSRDEGAAAMRLFVKILVACCLAHSVSAYKPILAMHGIGSGAGDWKHAADFVAKYHPGSTFIALPVYEVVESYVALREQVLLEHFFPGSLVYLLNPDFSVTFGAQQVAGIIRFISKLTDAQPQLFGQGYHLLCHSQGALLCRCIAQEWDNHNISALVSIAGPHVGFPAGGTHSCA